MKSLNQRTKKLLTVVLSVLGFFKNAELDTVAAGKSDRRLSALSDNEHVIDPGSEGVSVGVLEGYEVEVSVQVRNVHDGSDSSSVGSVGDVGQAVVRHGEELLDLLGFEVQADGVVGSDVFVREAEGAAVVGHEVGDLVGSDFLALDSAQLVCVFLSRELHEDEAALDVVEDSVGDADFGEVDDVHQSDGVLRVSADVLVNVDQALLLVEDDVSFAAIQGEFKLVAEDDLERDALAKLVGALARSDGEDASHFVHQPALWCAYSLQMFLRSSCLFSLPYQILLIYKSHCFAAKED